MAHGHPESRTRVTRSLSVRSRPQGCQLLSRAAPFTERRALTGNPGPGFLVTVWGEDRVFLESRDTS